MLDTNTGASSRTGTGTVSSTLVIGQSISFSTLTTFPRVKPPAVGPRAYKGSVASNRHHQRGHTALPALFCLLLTGRLPKADIAGRGVVVVAPRACPGHRPFRHCGAALLTQPTTKEEKTRREGANRPGGSCMRLAPLQAVAQITGRKEQEQTKPEQENTGPGTGRPVGVP